MKTRAKQTKKIALKLSPGSVVFSNYGDMGTMIPKRGTVVDVDLPKKGPGGYVLVRWDEYLGYPSSASWYAKHLLRNEA